jgi:septum formation protein
LQSKLISCSYKYSCQRNPCIIKQFDTLHSMSSKITLASASPRRRELLDQLGVSYDVLPVDIDESMQHGEADAAYAQRLAMEKAQAGFDRRGSEQPALGSDTIVVLNESVLEHRILGKPRNKRHGLAMLAALSARRHQVMTAVAMVSAEHKACLVNISQVYFRTISEAEISLYWDTGEPADKAGGYAVQGLAAQFIQRLDGSYSGVMGLPLFETGQLLNQFGIQLLSNQSR